MRTLTSDDLTAVAEVVAARIAPDPLPQYLTVTQVAERLAVGSTWVYENADEMGAVRLGSGKRAALRFPADRVTAYLNRTEVRA